MTDEPATSKSDDAPTPAAPAAEVAPSAEATDLGPAPGPPDPMAARIQALEAEVAVLRSELAAFKAASDRPPPTDGAPPRIFQPDSVATRLSEAAGRLEAAAVAISARKSSGLRWAVVGALGGAVATVLAVSALLALLHVQVGPLSITFSPRLSDVVAPVTREQTTLQRAGSLADAASREFDRIEKAGTLDPKPSE